MNSCTSKWGADGIPGSYARLFLHQADEEEERKVCRTVHICCPCSILSRQYVVSLVPIGDLPAPTRLLPSLVSFGAVFTHSLLSPAFCTVFLTCAIPSRPLEPMKELSFHMKYLPTLFLIPSKAILLIPSSSFLTEPRQVRCHLTDFATHHPDHKATHTRASGHPQVDAGVRGSVTINSRAEHSNEKCTMHKGECTDIKRRCFVPCTGAKSRTGQDRDFVD